MAQQELISVVIPTFDRAHTIGRALDSVLNQSRKADEIIVIDDGSTDDTSSILENIRDIHVIHTENNGVSSARNSGIKSSGGNWIAFLDSDDEWMPQKLEKQISLIQSNSEIKLVHSNEIWIRNGKRVNPQKKHEKSGGDIFRKCLPLCLISPSSVLVHRDLLDEVGLFDENLPACEDYDLWLRICAKHRVHYIEESLIIKYGGHEDQLSRKYWGMDRFRIKSLLGLLDSGDLSADQRKWTRDMIREKANIFIPGAEKRNRLDEASYYKNLLIRLEAIDQQ